MMKDDEPWWNIQIWASRFSVCHGCHGQKIAYFPMVILLNGRWEAWRGFCAAKGCWKRRTPWGFELSRVQGNKLQSFQVPWISWMFGIYMFRWGQRFLVKNWKTLNKNLMFIQWLLVTSAVLAAGWLVTCSPSRRRGCWAVPYVYTIYIYIYMLCICIYIYINYTTQIWYNM